MTFFEDFFLNYWAWFVVALIFLGLEMVVPGVLFLWLAIAGVVVGVISLIIPDMSWEIQLVIFSVLSVLSVFLGRNYLKKNPIQTDEETLNKRGHQYVGHTYVLMTDMENGQGKVKIGDTLWKVQGDFQAKTGDKVTVIETDGVLLNVTPVN